MGKAKSFPCLAFLYGAENRNAVIRRIFSGDHGVFLWDCFPKMGGGRAYNKNNHEKKDVFMLGKAYGYIRVSSREQNEDRQWIALQRQRIPRENIYVDKRSGKDFERPEYKKLLRRIKKDDLLYITSIDRLGRNYDEILKQWRILTGERGVDIIVLDMPLLDTRRGKDLMGTFLSDIVLQVLSFVAENERKNIRQRQAEGIAAAKARGVKFGRPTLPLPENFPAIFLAWERKELSVKEAAFLCDMPPSTFYAKAVKYRNAKETAEEN